MSADIDSAFDLSLELGVWVAYSFSTIVGLIDYFLFAAVFLSRLYIFWVSWLIMIASDLTSSAEILYFLVCFFTVLCFGVVTLKTGYGG